MKKYLSLFICLLLILSLASCGKKTPDKTSDASSGESTSPDSEIADDSSTESDSAPDSSSESETEQEVKYDRSGRYVLNDKGEAIIDDPELKSDYTIDDNSRIMYEIFVGSFSDSDGDGIGDLNGIINRMDYLNDGDPNSGTSLGVEGLWLTPVFKSRSYHKYDVDDYYQIDEKFGTEEDLKKLCELCHERHMKLILDLPINHTGKLNPWFTEFTVAHREGNTDNEYYDFYSYYKEGEQPPAGRTFNRIAGTDIYYECNFSQDMPELNFDNDAVRKAVLDVASYWLDLGVDGFRFDAAPYLYYKDNDSSAAFWSWYMEELRKIKPDIYTVAEVWASDSVTDKFYPALNCFNFTAGQVSGLLTETAQFGDVNRLTSYTEKYLRRIKNMREDADPVWFLSNHDMDRSAGYLTAASGQLRMAANLYLLAPGSSFIYYGEEIGMRGSRGSANTDANRRLAMLWGDGDTVKDPEGTSYGSDKQTTDTVASSLADGNSILSYYKKLIRIRNAHPEIARGSYENLEFFETKLGGFISTWKDSSVCVLHNTTHGNVTVDLSDVTDLEFTAISACIGSGTATLNGTELTLESQTSVILR